MGVTLSLVIWDLPSEPALLINDGQQLGKLFLQLPHHPGMDPIQARGLVSIQVAQQGSDCLLLDSWGSILLPMPVYHLRGPFVLIQLRLIQS